MNKKRAFTLIELLVVVSIIALLVSILLPALGKARAQARRVVDATNLHTIGICLNMYGTDNNDWLPVRNMDFELRYLTYDPYYIYLAEAVEDPRVLVCPEFRKSYYSQMDVNWCTTDPEERNRVYDMEPFPASWSNGDGMYLGYAYCGGKRMNGYVSDSGTNVAPWNWDNLLQVPGTVQWQSPLKITDSGQLTLMADHIELNGNYIEATHRQGGYRREYNLFVEPIEFNVLGGHRLLLGGSASWVDISSLEKHPRSNYIGCYSYW